MNYERRIKAGLIAAFLLGLGIGLGNALFFSQSYKAALISDAAIASAVVATLALRKAMKPYGIHPI